MNLNTISEKAQNIFCAYYDNKNDTMFSIKSKWIFTKNAQPLVTSDMPRWRLKTRRRRIVKHYLCLTPPRPDIASHGLTINNT